MKPQIQISAENEARRCRELVAVLAVPAERDFAADIARAFDELAEEPRLPVPEGANTLAARVRRDHAI